MSVDHQRLNLTNRKGHIRLLPEHLGDVDSGKRSVVSKIQSFFITSLTVEQSGELMAVAETELNLKPCPVNVIDIFAADRGIGREIQSVSTSGQIMDYQPYFLLQRLAPCHKFKSLAFLGIDVKPGHPAFVGICKINLAVLGLRPSSFTGARLFVDVIQHGIGTQTAYQRKTDFFQPLDKRQYGEGGIGNEQ